VDKSNHSKHIEHVDRKCMYYDLDKVLSTKQFSNIHCTVIDIITWQGIGTGSKLKGMGINSPY
jgi:hypothetical protein